MVMKWSVSRRLLRPFFLKSDVRLGPMALMLPALACLLAFSFPSYADIIFPTTTHVYFTRDGEPHDKPVDFTINCYGYWAYDEWRGGAALSPGTYTPELVFSFSASCPGYGCEVYEPFYLNYRHIDYCDCVGQTEGKPFLISDYGSLPVDFSQCETGNDALSRECELRLDIPVSAEVSDSETGDDDDGGGGGGCFVSSAQSP
ncbi:MAG: hypothetical protein SWE60_19490 [Thermodesulfobacteriota bacterium]|nr:hypothetical protein [Thermodesulfobacteriota bacterium]